MYFTWSTLYGQSRSFRSKLYVSIYFYFVLYLTCGHSIYIVLHVFDLIPGASRQNDAIMVQTKTAVTQVAVCRAGIQEDQYIAFMDVNQDLFCTLIQSNGGNFEFYKIGTQLVAFMWSSEANVLVGLHDSSYSVWYCPGESCADPTFIALTTVTFDTT